MGTDQVGAILQGLQLDKQYFYKYVQVDKYRGDRPKSAGEPRKLAAPAGTSDGTTSPKVMSPKWGKATNEAREMARQKTKAAHASPQKQKNADFDLYLAEQLLPVLAQGLDALGRQVARASGSAPGPRTAKVDPTVTKRFNPRTWLAQFLLRNHPKHASTPRRRSLYADFKGWTDLERGRREVLSRKHAIQLLFDGFSKKRKVGAKDIPKVIGSMDESWWLGGKLTNHVLVPKDFSGYTPTDQFTFEDFWNWLVELVTKNDVIRHSDFAKGVEQRMVAEQKRQAELQERQAREEEERQRQEEKQEQLRTFEAHVALIKQSQDLRRILDEDCMLTGAVSSMEGENVHTEIPPYGGHTTLLKQLLQLLGFDSLEAEPAATAEERAKAQDACMVEPWWEDPAMTCWMLVQRALGCGVQDGIVDRESLSAAIDVSSYFELRLKVQRERDDEELLGMGDVVAGIAERLKEEEAEYALGLMKEPAAEEPKKQTFEQLSATFELTQVRIQWLHEQFAGLCPDGIDEYPHNPSSLTKEVMRDLYGDLKPDMSDEEFDAQFAKIDEDGSGEIEFDEFVKWISEEEIDLGDSDEEEDEE